MSEHSKYISASNFVHKLLFVVIHTLINCLQLYTHIYNINSGYAPPEYIERGIYSTKSDVYSFGILVLQIISGKKVSNLHGKNRNMSLIQYVSFFDPLSESNQNLDLN